MSYKLPRRSNNTGLETMKHYLLTLIATVVLGTGLGCEPQPRKDTKHTTDTELRLVDGEPLLLEENPSSDSPADIRADNSRCHVCHINYASEDIAVTHARANIGCKNCHGGSDAHIADESWASGGNGTAPDIMYRRLRINPACMNCHRRESIDTVQHKPLFDGSEDKVCTDCHGSHRLSRRRCKWK